MSAIWHDARHNRMSRLPEKRAESPASPAIARVVFAEELIPPLEAVDYASDQNTASSAARRVERRLKVACCADSGAISRVRAIAVIPAAVGSEPSRACKASTYRAQLHSMYRLSSYSFVERFSLRNVQIREPTDERVELTRKCA